MRIPKDELRKAIVDHLLTFWSAPQVTQESLGFGPILRSIPGFRILMLHATGHSNPWVYCSAGCYKIPVDDHIRHEFFLVSPSDYPTHIETLTMLANLHADARYRVRLGEVIDIGRPWLENSTCDHLLISLPYPYGPKLEWLRLGEVCLRFLWALPITAREAAFAELNGHERLEEQFDAAGINYLDVMRASVV